MDVVNHLAVAIGPRGSCTPKEAEAARWVGQQLEKIGLTPINESFKSASSTYRPYAAFGVLALVGELMAWLAGRPGAIMAVVLLAAAIVSILLELTFRSNLLRWLSPKGSSQNVWTRLVPSGEKKHRVVLLAHLDTHRTPWLFSEKLVKLIEPLVPLALVSSLVMLALFSINIAWPKPLWLLISLPFALILLLVLVLMIQADMTPYTAGANDNATGVGVLLGLVERLKEKPLTNTTVWAVFTGCEEVGCYGADAFATAHKDELDRPIWISIDSVGGKGAGVAYLEKETFLTTTKSDAELLELAARISSDSPELDAYPFTFKGAFTEGVIGNKHGFRVLSLVSYMRNGVLPEWHRPTDVVENVEARVVENTQAFMIKMLAGIDDF
jgi:hypothetical protein